METLRVAILELLIDMKTSLKYSIKCVQKAARVFTWKLFQAWSCSGSGYPWNQRKLLFPFPICVAEASRPVLI